MTIRRRLLIAGCTENDIERCRDACSDLSCRIETASGGEGLLDQLQRFQPHLVLLDAALTNPDAYGLCRQIKSDTTALVMIVTAPNNVDDMNLAVDAGTDDFLCKPINKNELSNRAATLFLLCEALH